MEGPINAATFKKALLAANLKEPKPLIIEKCAGLCERYSMAIEDIIFQIEAFLSNNSIDSITLETFGKFEQEIHRESAKGPISSKKKPTINTSQSKPPLSRRPIEMPSPTMMPVKRESSFSTPDDSMGNKSAKISYRDTPSPDHSQGSQGSPLIAMESEPSQEKQILYSQRGRNLKPIVETHKELGTRGTFEPSSKTKLGMRCEVEANEDDFDNVKERYRYMFTTLDERARAFEKHLITMQVAMCALASVAPEDLTPVGIPSQDAVWVCGRICCETTEGKINNTSVILEGSMRESSGRKVDLDLQEMTGFSLFPGQIVMVYGTNSTGRRMLATKIIEGTHAPLPTTSPGQLLEFHHSSAHQGGKPLSVFIAAGPFTTDQNLNYEPLMDLLKETLSLKPDVLILTGPFVDITQPIIASGDMQIEDDDNRLHNASYEMLFIERVLRNSINSLYVQDKNSPTQIILVPSLLDAHHEFVFPQPPFGDRDRLENKFFDEDLGVLRIPFSEEGPLKRMHLMPNPCMFRVNEVLFGVTSNDALFALSSDETSKNIPGGNRLGRLVGHLLQQQSFAPQYPLPASSLSQLDMRQAKHWQMKVCPDVLVVPSRLTTIVKELAGTLIVNPGQLVKGSTGGSYACLDIHPIKETELRDAKIAGKEELLHAVAGRTSVSIKKI